MLRIKTLAVLLPLVGSLPSLTSAQDLVIEDIVVAPGIAVAQRDADLAAVRAFYGFWNTGDQNAA